jgi:hypothetical protein
VAHPTFRISKLKLFLHDDQKPDWKQILQLEVDAIEHMLTTKIEGILCARQTRLQSKEHLVNTRAIIVRKQCG